MGLVAEVKAVERVIENGGHGVDVQVDPGGGANTTAHHYSAPGEDSLPLAGDWAACESSSGQGNLQVSGYADSACAPKAGNGEKRIYSRSGPGIVAAEIWLKADGTIVSTNGSTIVEQGPDSIRITGNLIVTGEITAMSETAPVKLSTHLHPTAMGPSSAPTPGT